jgi:hypothetical protein
MNDVTERAERSKRAEWTGKKLDMVDCLNVDRRVPPRAFKIAVCILQHVNARTLETYLSDETIGEETGTCERHVVTARNRLRETRWFTWERTGKGNIYRPLFDQVNRFLDLRIVTREARKKRRLERKEQRKKRRRDPTNLSERKRRDPTNLSEHDPTKLSVRDPTNLSDIHLRENTSEEHLKDQAGFQGGNWIEGGGQPTKLSTSEQIPLPAELRSDTQGQSAPIQIVQNVQNRLFAAPIERFENFEQQAKPATQPVGDTWTDVQEERAAIIEHDSKAPRAWAEALARLDPNSPPDDVPPRRWLTFIDDSGRFVDRGWAERATAFGWGPLDLFGCDRGRPLALHDHKGLLWLVNGGNIIELHRDRAIIETRIGARQSCRRVVEFGRVALAWELAPVALDCAPVCAPPAGFDILASQTGNTKS